MKIKNVKPIAGQTPGIYRDYFLNLSNRPMAVVEISFWEYPIGESGDANIKIDDSDGMPLVRTL